jgi:hypothetical protein
MQFYDRQFIGEERKKMELSAKILGIGGCPKHKVCSMYNPKGETCRFGPYQYCGKYRLLNEEAEGNKTAVLEISH